MNLLKGIAFMVSSQLLFVLAWTFIKFLGERLPLFEIVFFRAFISLLILVPFTWLHLRSFRGKNKLGLFLRALFGFLGMVMVFYAMIHMQIGNAVTLFNTSPVFVALFAPLMLEETFSLRKLAITAIAFAGIGLIVKPGIDILNAASIYALIAGLLGALSMLFIKKLAATDSATTITLYYTAFSALGALPVAAFHFVVPTTMEWGFFLVIGIAVTIGQLFMTRSYRYDHASTIAPFSYASVVGSYVAGMIVFNEVPDMLSILGAAVIIACGIAIMLSEPRTAESEEIRSAKVT
jgi:drug/metabolite transporter (DMT)-like permease